MKKKKIVIAIVAILISTILLFPTRVQYEDGGSVGRKALLYEVITLHEIGGNDDVNPYIEGTEITILGMTVYRNTNE